MIESHLASTMISQLTLTDRTESTDDGEHEKIPTESDVLPPFESICPVNPCGDENQRPKSSEVTTRDTVEISSQGGDDLRGNWFVVSQLGEGAYGDVKLIEDVHQHRLLAMKIVLGHSKPEDQKRQLDLVHREILIHKYLYHESIIRFIGSRSSGPDNYIFLEYACGGELYDRMDPDIGVPRDSCHKWFVQLIAGLDYLHRRGIVHRDIKPENLLLDEKDDLKISDFGLATVFKMGERKRKINSRRGTPVYVAPEVLSQDSFDAEPLDIWSAGIVLVAMISGELPWDQAVPENESFLLWKMATLTVSPWNKLPSECLGLVRKMLDPNPVTRATVARIHQDHWFRRGFTDKALENPPSKRVRYDPQMSSVPVQASRKYKETGTLATTDNHADHNLFSQPVRLEDLLVSQTQGMECLMEQSPFARMVKRITRFYITCSIHEVIETLSGVLDQLHMQLKRASVGSYTVSGQDRHKGVLAFKVCFVQNQDKILMDFRLSKGNGLEFKRIFAIVRQKLYHIIAQDPVAWTTVAEPEAKPVIA